MSKSTISVDPNFIIAAVASSNLKLTKELIESTLKQQLHQAFEETVLGYRSLEFVKIMVESGANLSTLERKELLLSIDRYKACMKVQRII